MLRFLGRGSAFNEEQNCAFFVEKGRLVLLDCAMSGFHAVRRTGLERLADEMMYQEKNRYYSAPGVDRRRNV